MQQFPPSVEPESRVAPARSTGPCERMPDLAPLCLHTAGNSKRAESADGIRLHGGQRTSWPPALSSPPSPRTGMKEPLRPLGSA
eukprot:superscaffoldBa00000526_g5408